MKFLLIAFLSAFVLNGCSTITIADADGVISYERKLGLIALSADSSNRTFVADMTSLGYSSTPMGISFGYSKHSFAFVSDECKIVLWIKNREQLSELQKLVGDNDSICTVVGDQK